MSPPRKQQLGQGAAGQQQQCPEEAPSDPGGKARPPIKEAS